MADNINFDFEAEIESSHLLGQGQSAVSLHGQVVLRRLVHWLMVVHGVRCSIWAITMTFQCAAHYLAHVV